jgi:hypothetical protein
MKKYIRAAASLLLIASLGGCYVVPRQAIYVSPFNGNNNAYHSIPLKSDSIRSAFFAHASFSAGSANYTSNSSTSASAYKNGDDLYSFEFNIYRTHNAGVLELYYGGHFALGNYSVNKFDSVLNDPTVNYQNINQYAGKKSFGGYGLDAGTDIIVPIYGGSEWRVLGFEFSLTREFGQYRMLLILLQRGFMEAMGFLLKLGWAKAPSVLNWKKAGSWVASTIISRS